MTIVISTDDSINFQTLAGLKSSISARLDREFEDSDLNDFIYLAEREMERVLNVPYREAVTPVTIDAQAVNLPIDFKAVRRFALTGDPQTVLSPVSAAVLASGSDFQATGKPVVFCIIGGQLWVGPSPDGTYSAQLIYEQKISPLTESSPSNWVLNKHPDVYFYGALVQAADFIADPSRIALYRSAFDNAIDQVNAEGVRFRNSAAPARIRSATVV